MFRQPPWNKQHSITPEIAALMGAMTGKPVAGGFGYAVYFGAINRKKRIIARLARFHFNKDDEITAPRNNINLAAMCCIGQIKNAPAAQTQPQAREKFRLDPEASGAASTLR